MAKLIQLFKAIHFKHKTDTRKRLNFLEFYSVTVVLKKG